VNVRVSGMSGCIDTGQPPWPSVPARARVTDNRETALGSPSAGPGLGLDCRVCLRSAAGTDAALLALGNAGEQVVPGGGGLGGAGEVVVALGGGKAAVAEQRRGEADLLGPVERDGGGGGIAEQMRVDRLTEGGAGVGDNPAVGLLAAEPPAPGTIPCPAPAEQQPVRTTKMVLAAEYLDPLIAARVLDLGELADQHLDHGFLLLTRTEAYPVSTQIESA
jgi:hypothetical protein